MITTNKITRYKLQNEEKREKAKDLFNLIILKAVDETLTVFGQRCKHALYHHFRHAFQIKKQEIPSKIENFAEALEQIFGAAAKLIELRIIETLHKKIPHHIYAPKVKDLVFTEYIADLRNFYLVINSESNNKYNERQKPHASKLLETSNTHLLLLCNPEIQQQT